jgi:hypothetical protein
LVRQPSVSCAATLVRLIVPSAALLPSVTRPSGEKESTFTEGEIPHPLRCFTRVRCRMRLSDWHNEGGCWVRPCELRGIGEEVGSGAPLLVAEPQPADESRRYQRVCATAEAFIYVAMTRLMVRRLARA